MAGMLENGLSPTLGPLSPTWATLPPTLDLLSPTWMTLPPTYHRRTLPPTRMHLSPLNYKLSPLKRGLSPFAPLNGHYHIQLPSVTYDVYTT